MLTSVFKCHSFSRRAKTREMYYLTHLLTRSFNRTCFINDYGILVYRYGYGQYYDKKSFGSYEKFTPIPPILFRPENLKCLLFMPAAYIYVQFR